MSSEVKTNDLAVEFINVTKKYSRGEGAFKFTKLVRSLKRMQFRSDIVEEKFCVLDNVSFSIKKGERVAFVGRNGAGKSTLLKLVNRVVYPTQGEIKIHGYTGGVIELGAGFDSELSAKDNVYLMGSLYGHSIKAIDAMANDIFEISELHLFKDTPLKRFSSGMKARLGFALSLTATPDIVLLDEVLAVGDASFKKKSTHLIHQFLKDRTLLFVSHSENQIAELCNRVIYIHDAKVVFDGPTKEGLEMYRDSMKKTFNPLEVKRSLVVKDPKQPQILPIVEIKEFLFLNERVKGDGTPKFLNSDRVKMRMTLNLREKPLSPLKLIVRLKVSAMGDQIISTLAQTQIDIAEEELKQQTLLEFAFDAAPLSDGRYWVEIESELPARRESVAGQAVELPFVIHSPSFSWLPLKTQYKEIGQIKTNFSLDRLENNESP